MASVSLRIATLGNVKIALHKTDSDMLFLKAAPAAVEKLRAEIPEIGEGTPLTHGRVGVAVPKVAFTEKIPAVCAKFADEEKAATAAKLAEEKNGIPERVKAMILKVEATYKAEEARIENEIATLDEKYTDLKNGTAEYLTGLSGKLAALAENKPVFGVYDGGADEADDSDEIEEEDESAEVEEDDDNY